MSDASNVTTAQQPSWWVLFGAEAVMKVRSNNTQALEENYPTHRQGRP
jgi:hypothetical protein